jgi:hypothetical protein
MSENVKSPKSQEEIDREIEEFKKKKRQEDMGDYLLLGICIIALVIVVLVVLVIKNKDAAQKVVQIVTVIAQAGKKYLTNWRQQLLIWMLIGYLMVLCMAGTVAYFEQYYKEMAATAPLNIDRENAKLMLSLMWARYPFVFMITTLICAYMWKVKCGSWDNGVSIKVLWVTGIFFVTVYSAYTTYVLAGTIIETASNYFNQRLKDEQVEGFSGEKTCATCSILSLYESQGHRTSGLKFLVLSALLGVFLALGIYLLLFFTVLKKPFDMGCFQLFQDANYWQMWAESELQKEEETKALAASKALSKGSSKLRSMFNKVSGRLSGKKEGPEQNKTDSGVKLALSPMEQQAAKGEVMANILSGVLDVLKRGADDEGGLVRMALSLEDQKLSTIAFQQGVCDIERQHGMYKDAVAASGE